MSDNFFDSQLNQPANNTGDFSNAAANAWGPGEKLNVIKKDVSGNGKTGSNYSGYTAHDWIINESGNGTTLKQDDGIPLSVRKDDLGTDNLGNQIIGISFKTTGSDPSEVRMVMHKDGNGQFLGIEDSIHFNPQTGQQTGYDREMIAGSRDDSALNADLKNLADATNPEHKFLVYKLGELNNKLGAVGTPQTSQQNLEQMLNQVDSKPWPTQQFAPAQMPTGYQNARPINTPIQSAPGSYSYQGNYQRIPTNNEVRRGAGIGNMLMNGLNNGLRMRNTYDGSLYQHIPCSGPVQRPSVYQGQYQHIPSNDGTKDVNAILQAKRDRLIREGRLPANQIYEDSSQSQTKTNVYGRLDGR
ncbi:MAG: hypothetical protein K2Y22_08690 [Candidatus Obscuribacterales bacterium]|nr:hypothetical protein [Candidatus Obscuribacterales bacterium]